MARKERQAEKLTRRDERRVKRQLPPGDPQAVDPVTGEPLAVDPLVVDPQATLESVETGEAKPPGVDATPPSGK